MFLFCSLFISCGNTKEQISQVTYEAGGPQETSRDVTMLFSDKGLSKMKLESPLLYRYDLEEDNEMKMECPIGMVVTFYDTLGNVESVLTSKYGVLYSKKEYIKVKDSVVFVNIKEEQLNTNLLHIDFKKDSVYTHEKVVVTSPKGTISGVGFNSNTNFTKYKVHNISHGEFEMEEEALKEEENE